MVLMVDGHISISMSELNDEDYSPPVKDLEYDEYEEGPGDYDPPGTLSDGGHVLNTDYGIPPRDNSWLRGKILAVWERYKPLLEND